MNENIFSDLGKELTTKWGLLLLFIISLSMFLVLIGLKIKYQNKFADFHKNQKTSELLLALSNIAYILPILVVIYGVHTKKMSLAMGVEISLLLCMVVFFSTNYHICRSELAKDSNDPDEIGYVNLPESPCKGMGGEMTDRRAKLFDHFMATFTIAVILLHFTKLSCDSMMLARIIVFALIIIPMSLNVDKGQKISVIPVTIIGFYMVYSLWKSHWLNYDKMTKIIFSLGVIFTVFGFSFFSMISRPYWLMHSLWHISGGLATTFLLIAYVRSIK